MTFARKLLPLLAIALGLLAACGPDTSGITSLTGDVTNGKTVYELKCSQCHGADGSGHHAAAEAKSDIDSAAAIILTGEDEMPAFEGTLTSQQIADVLAYLKSLP